MSTFVSRVGVMGWAEMMMSHCLAARAARILAEAVFRNTSLSRAGWRSHWQGRRPNRSECPRVQELLGRVRGVGANGQLPGGDELPGGIVATISCVGAGVGVGVGLGVTTGVGFGVWVGAGVTVVVPQAPTAIAAAASRPTIRNLGES